MVLSCCKGQIGQHLAQATRWQPGQAHDRQGWSAAGAQPHDTKGLWCVSLSGWKAVEWAHACRQDSMWRSGLLGWRRLRATNLLQAEGGGAPSMLAAHRQDGSRAQCIAAPASSDTQLHAEAYTHNTKLRSKQKHRMQTLHPREGRPFVAMRGSGLCLCRGVPTCPAACTGSV